MPNVIDNQKVSDTIRKLLKENSMTQEDLANALSITKSAVSQNLRGKSNFDIQNLIAIAKLFDITLDELLSLKEIESDDVITEYRRVVRKGLASIKHVPVNELKIADADLYGKVLVEYIIEENAIDMFNYLNNNEANFVSDKYHRAKTIYIKIIKYMLENNIKGIFKYVLKYTNLNGSFNLDRQFEPIIWNLLELENNQDEVKAIITYGKNEKFWDKIFRDNINIPLSNSDILIIVAKHKLNNVFKTYLEYISKRTELTEITKQFLDHGYIEGVEMFINKHFNEPITEFNKWMTNPQDSILLVAKNNHLKLLKQFLEKGIYVDLSQIVVEAANNSNYEIVNYLIENYEDKIDYSSLAEVLVKKQALEIFSKISSKLENKEINRLLAFVDKDDIDMLKALFKLGARFSIYHFEYNQFEKINSLIKKLIDEEDKK